MTDLGALLSLCSLPTQDDPDDACVHAVVRGYQQHRTLTTSEQAVLVDAIQLRTLILLAVSFGQRSHSKYDEHTLLYGHTYEQWYRNYQMAPRIADRALTIFADGDAFRR